jgi:hypothetical protein
VVRSLWVNQIDLDHLVGITGFRFDENLAAEDQFVAMLGTIELHPGPFSSNFPYNILNVLGARLTMNVRDALSEIGFSHFVEANDGFTALRTRTEANIRTESHPWLVVDLVTGNYSGGMDQDVR